MKVISLNIETDNHYERIFSFVDKHKPDVICMQEVLEKDFEYIKERLGMDGIFKVFMRRNPAYTLDENLKKERDGVAIFSRSITRKGHFFYWGKEENLYLPYAQYLENEEHSKNYVALWVDTIDKDGNTMRFVTTHFPVTQEGESTPHQLEILAPFFKELDRLGEFVLCGDFNAPRGNETFSRIKERYYDAIPSHYITSLDQNLHRVKGLIYMVDGLFLTESYSATEVTLEDGVSDHMAVVATINKV